MTEDVEIQQAFRADLQALLDKYDAELEAKDHYQGYPECGEDVRMTAMIRGERWVEVDLGRYLCAEKKGEGNTMSDLSEVALHELDALREEVPELREQVKRLQVELEKAKSKPNEPKVRADALEEAAKECDDIVKYPQCDGLTFGAAHCARRIRALAEKGG